MKHTLFIFALITATIQTFAQSPRIKLNQITKDSVTGSVLISSPTDSGMVYSRDLFISYGADTVLILGGDTLAATSSIISSVLSDGVTITGDGTIGSELTADTSVLATLRALSDSLALVISSVTADGVTITGDGTVGSPLTVDTATVIATKGDLDLYYLDSNPDGYTSNTGTVTSVAATAGTGISVSGSPITTSGTLNITNTAPDQTVSIAGGGINAVTGTYPSFTVTGTEVDGSVSNEIQDISTTGAAGNISISSGSTLNLNVDDSDASATNEGSLTVGAGTASTSVISSNTSGSTDVTLTAGTNVTLSETGNNITISATGGGTTFNNISETADTVYISDYLDVDTSTLYVDATENRVGIGTSSPSAPLTLYTESGSGKAINYSNSYSGWDSYTYSDISSISGQNGYVRHRGTFDSPSAVQAEDWVGVLNFAAWDGNSIEASAGVFGYVDGSVSDEVVPMRLSFVTSPTNNAGRVERLTIKSDGKVGIGTSSPSLELDVNGNARFQSIGSGASAGALHYTSTGVLTTNTSDVRLKTNLQPLENTLQKLLNINTYSFNWINETNRVDLGMVAQEVEEIFPRLVFTNPVDGYKGIHYDKFSSILTKAIQEQQAIIDQQASEIEQLKTLITELSNRLQILENN